MINFSLRATASSSLPEIVKQVELCVSHCCSVYDLRPIWFSTGRSVFITEAVHMVTTHYTRLL